MVKMRVRAFGTLEGIIAGAEKAGKKGKVREGLEEEETENEDSDHLFLMPQCNLLHRAAT